MACKNARLGLLFAGLVLLPSSARAYILPAPSILSIVAKHRARLGFKSIVATGKLRTGSGPAKDVWMGILAGRGHRTEVKTSDGTKVTLTTSDNRRFAFDLGSPAGAATRVKDDLFTNFLARPKIDPGGSRGVLFLKKNRIDDEVVSLGRHHRRVVYIIGAKPWETDRPQLWIDKELMVPVRLITLDGGQIRDLQLLEFGSGLTGAWLPRRIEVREGGTLIEATDFESVTPNGKIDEGLFSAPAS